MAFLSRSSCSKDEARVPESSARLRTAHVDIENGKDPEYTKMWQTDIPPLESSSPFLTKSSRKANDGRKRNAIDGNGDEECEDEVVLNHGNCGRIEKIFVSQLWRHYASSRRAWPHVAFRGWSSYYHFRSRSEIKRLLVFEKFVGI